jgi:hypothetical protein
MGVDRHVRVAHRDIQVTVCVPPVTESAACEPRHAARMTVRELNYETIRGRVRKPMHAVRAKILILPLSPSATTGALWLQTIQWYLESHLHREERG